MHLRLRLCLTVAASALLVTTARAQAPLDLGLQALQEGDEAEALRLLLPLAEGGNVLAAFAVGLAYDSEPGVPRDAAQAAKWYRRAGEGGLPTGLLYYAVFVQNGDGVPKDVAQAAALYKQVAAMPDVQGSAARAAQSLGELYYEGAEVTKDLAEALRWSTMAAEAGYPDAQYRIGYMLWQGEGVARSDSAAAVWLRRASEQRHTQAMGGLMALLFGSGDPARYAEAYVWGSLAAELDPVQAMLAGRLVVEQYLTPAQKAEAERQKEAWRARWAAEGSR